MDINELLKSGRVPLDSLVTVTLQKMILLEVQQELIISQLTQIIATVENRDFDEVAKNVTANHKVMMEKAHRHYLEVLAKNMQ